jgi:hypothetical protein
MSGRSSLKDGPGDKLNDDNWPVWKEQMDAFLHIKGVSQWIEKELPSDATDDQKNGAKLAASWIKLCVSDRWLRRISGLTPM